MTLPAPQSSGDGLYSQNIVIDTLAPTVLEFEVLFGTQSYNLIGSARYDLPWQITGIRVVFSEPVNATSSSLQGTNITIGSFSGSGTNTLTWSINTLTSGSFGASLNIGTITDVASNTLSGANTAENFKVLYGDFNGDGVVNSSDMVGVNNATVGAYNIFANLNGDGKVDVNDVAIARSQSGKHL